MAIYLKFDSIKGSTTDSQFKDQIELESFQWGAGIGCSSARGGDRTTSEPSVSEITASKQTDKSSELLFKALLKGDAVGKGVISFTAAIKGESVAYATLTLEEVIVSGFSMSSGGGDSLPTESISLNFTKFDWSFKGRDVKQAGNPTHLIYSLVENKVG
ncbi:Hcp1 family type VI secretion system effector [Sphingomonas sp. MAH-20]|uniref:Hcp1 family type VI secretion system effector n=1 Tax=Sphingomonas horti TaxID=2682842 RepID=A0A6I4IXI3_9SPHN|nr:type VI secretion system tube protein Hcp [Sphingomonas sp. CGMCC 1.13658]MBA2920545.1 type VI secretion system tube protein Hcp [Sphingomonas sp. CGMCC 1.13658]MVO76797.1 Hcp1 family type VI secretion system effector [Sphingomonas horti]